VGAALRRMDGEIAESGDFKPHKYGFMLVSQSSRSITSKVETTRHLSAVECLSLTPLDTAWEGKRVCRVQ
jgi:hypothetical protein